MTGVDPFPCGPTSWKSKLPGWAHAPQFVFRDACELHDLLYMVGGSEGDRRIADRRFYATMIAALAGRPLLSRVYFRLWAYVYYSAVRHYGSAHFAHS